MPEEYEEYPRPDGNYYEYRHEFLTQGDVYRDVPWSQLGPTLTIVDPTPEGLPVPAGHLPALTYVWPFSFGMILSDTCDFRHPRAQDVTVNRANYRDPDSVYHSGFLRVAPVIPLSEYEGLPPGASVRERIRLFDHFRRLIYLPPMVSADGLVVMPESVVAVHMADLLHLDLVRSLARLSQLTLLGRQQLARKLVYAETGYQVAYDRFSPDLD